MQRSRFTAALVIRVRSHQPGGAGGDFALLDSTRLDRHTFARRPMRRRETKKPARFLQGDDLPPPSTPKRRSSTGKATPGSIDAGASPRPTPLPKPPHSSSASAATQHNAALQQTLGVSKGVFVEQVVPTLYSTAGYGRGRPGTAGDGRGPAGTGVTDGDVAGTGRARPGGGQPPDADRAL